MHELTLREFINTCYFVLVRGVRDSPEEGGDTAEDQIQRFEEQIGLRHNPEDDALAKLREWQISQGIDPDKPKVNVDAEKPWWEDDVEL